MLCTACQTPYDQKQSGFLGCSQCGQARLPDGRRLRITPDDEEVCDMALQWLNQGEMCRQGHLLKEGNFYLVKGYRRCKLCENDRRRKYYRQKTSKKGA